MKKIIALLLALMMVLCLFAGCAEEEAPAAEDKPVEDNKPAEDTKPAEEEEEQPAEEEEEEPAVVETEEPIIFAWNAAGGTDTHIESPHRDNQCPLPDMLWEGGYTHNPVTNTFDECLGTNWTVSDDYMTFSMEVKDGIYWSNGDPLTVDDFVWSIYNQILNPNSVYSGSWNKVVGYDAFKEGTTDTLEGLTVEGNKITVTMTEPQVTWNHLQQFYILPAKAFEGIAWADVDVSDYFKAPYGTGAFMVEEVSFPDYVTVVRNENYHGEPAGFKRAKFVSYAAGGNDAAVAAMIAGEIDFGTRQIILDGTVASNIVAQNADIEWIRVPGGGVRLFWFRTQPRADGKESPWINDVRVRKAIDLLINQEMLSAFLPETTTPAYTLMGTAAFEYNTELPQVAYDPEQAIALLDDYGWDYETEIQLAYYYDDQVTHDSMLAIEQDFAAAGVKLDAFLLTGDLAAAIYTDCNYDILLGMASYDTLKRNAANYNSLTAGSSHTFLTNFGQAEFVAKYTEILGKYDATGDQAERKALAWQLQEMNAEDCWILPGYTNANLVAYNTKTLSIPVDFFESGSLQGNGYWSLWKNLK